MADRRKKKTIAEGGGGGKSAAHRLNTLLGSILKKLGEPVKSMVETEEHRIKIGDKKSRFERRRERLKRSMRK